MVGQEEVMDVPFFCSSVFGSFLSSFFCVLVFFGREVGFVWLVWYGILSIYLSICREFLVSEGGRVVRVAVVVVMVDLVYMQYFLVSFLDMLFR